MSTAYRSPKGLATAARGLLLLFILVAGVDAAANAATARLGDRIQADANLVGVAQLEATEQRLTITAGVLAVVFLAGLGFLIAWTSRVYRNLPALEAPDLRFTPGWAIGGWFVPFLNFVRPKQILDDAWRVSCPDGDATDWHRRRVTPLLHVWWGLWIFGGLLGFSVPDSFDLSSLESAAISSCVADGMLIIASALAIVVITRITEGQELRTTGTAPRRSSTWEHAVWVGPTASMAVFVALFAGFAAIDDDSSADGHPSESSNPSDEGRRSVLVMDLALGDCIDEPRGEPAGPDEATVLAVNVRPCHQRHDGEVVGVVRHPAGDEAAFPGEDAIFEHAKAACGDAFEEWVGIDFFESSLDLFFLYPNQEGWDLGDRTIQCVAVPMDGQPLDGSVRRTGI
jgi:hypothetical protein